MHPIFLLFSSKIIPNVNFLEAKLCKIVGLQRVYIELGIFFLLLDLGLIYGLKLILDISLNKKKSLKLFT